jgi:carbonic anhydrase
MDARLRVPAALGLEPGDAHVLRNAGAIVTEDVMRSLAISQRLLGTRGVMVIGHTDCGMARLDEAELRAELREAAGADPPFAIGAFSDVEASVRASVLALRASPLLPHRDAIRGFVYDVATHLLTEVAIDGA